MPDETLLAFDFGIKRIGIALGAARLGQARALVCIDAEANDIRFAAIGKLIDEWQPARLLVGRPLNDDGTPHEMTARCERFTKQLRGRFHLPVEEVDERFSSIEAESALHHPLRRGGCFLPDRLVAQLSHQRRVSWQERKARIDAEAARIILQSWFDSRTTHATTIETTHAAA